MSLLLLALVVFVVLALLLLRSALGAWRARQRLGTLVAVLTAALCLAVGALCGTISVGIRGYRALTQEVVAATIQTEPLGNRHFRATVTLADGTLHMFDLAGDMVYVDAHILKWRSIVNLLGLHTAYELDRISGRYRTLGDEQTQERTVFSIARRKPIDVFDLARRYWLLRPLVDAEYGSATFINAGEPAIYEIRVSTTGLLVRRVFHR
ncbi:MAG TPA: hypothetical protein VGQ18_01280 [Gemmatimonadales bacterium]|jgi:hypothetical protein|nr:hypothetical protein [Gemmatimonadales bacterium]